MGSKEEQDGGLTERVVVRMSKADRDGMQWAIKKRLAAMGGADIGVTLTEAAYMRAALVAFLKAEGSPWHTPGAHPTEEPRAPTPRPAAPEAEPKITPFSVRKRLQQAYKLGLTRRTLHELTDIPQGWLSHFLKGADPSRSNATPERLRALDTVLRRWLDEHSGG